MNEERDDVLTKKDIQNKGLKRLENPKQLGRDQLQYFFCKSVTSKGFHEGKSQSENSSQSLPSKSLVPFYD